MASNYYLLNGKLGEGNALDLKSDGKLKRNFSDISTLDLLTMDIPISSARDVLKEYNPDTNLDGIFYDAQYPIKKVETKTFAPVFGFENEKCKYYMDHLRYFAEQRDRKVQKGEKVALDNNTILKDYLETLLYNIIRYNNRKIIRQDSIVAKNVKDEIEDCFKLTGQKSVENILKSRYKLKMLLDHYTQIRNLTLEYLASITEERIPNRREINSFSRYENYGMEPRESAIIPKEKKSDKQVKYYQMTLNDFNHLKK